MSPRSRSAALQSVSSAAAAAAKHRATVPQFYFPQARRRCRSPASGPSLTRLLRPAPRAEPRARRCDGKQDQCAVCIRCEQRHAACSFCRRGPRGVPPRSYDCVSPVSACLLTGLCRWSSCRLSFQACCSTGWTPRARGASLASSSTRFGRSAWLARTRQGARSRCCAGQASATSRTLTSSR